LFDISMSLCLIGLLSVPMIVITILIRLSSKGNVIFWSDRIGAGNSIFRMPKFRTMHQNTPHVATHLMTQPDLYVTPIGRILRKTSMDELPQLFSVLKGDMSFVGPRPALFNQYDLIALRTDKEIHRLIPGITGWAQINGRDELPIPVKVQYDAFYKNNSGFNLDLIIILKTILQVVRKEGINH
jgi:O-antigen biosynthesis protein WbqP